MEHLPHYRFSELFTGNWELFENAVKNPKTIFVYDIDGILSDTPKVVLGRFTKRTGIKTDPTEINQWNYLTSLAANAGLADDIINNAENEWFDPEILALAKKYLYITPVVEKTLNYHGQERNFALTARNPAFKESTSFWFSLQYPGFKKENILMRNNNDIDATTFKVANLTALARLAPWVIYIDDSVEFTKAALEAGLENCLVVNIPLGKIVPEIRHDHQFLIKRFPDRLQAMYPLLDAINRALEGGKSP